MNPMVEDTLVKGSKVCHVIDPMDPRIIFYCPFSFHLR